MKNKILCTIIILVFTVSLTTGLVNAVKDEEVDNVEEIKLIGELTYRNLESGFYEVEGYRLIGDYDFEQYKGKNVIVKGNKDNSVSIFMTKAINVMSIKEFDGKLDDVKRIDTNVPPIPTKTDEETEKRLNIGGVVKYNDLEGGFYEIEGYRLIGDQDFKAYKNKEVLVTGELDDSVGIYMTKAIKVETIDEMNNLIDVPVDEPVLDKPVIEEPIADEDEVITEGKLFRNNLEGGFYEVNGYRLITDEDLAQYVGKAVKVTGTYDNSPGIFMVKAIIVENIEQVNAKELVKKIERRIVDIMSGEIFLGEKDLEEADKLKIIERIKNTINLFEQIVSIEGNEALMQRYEELGKLLSLVEDRVNVYVNGNKPMFDEEVPPYIENARTLMPYRAVVESLGAKVDWNDELKKVTVEKDETKVELVIGQKTAYINGEVYELDVAPTIKNNRTVVPLRFVSESLNAQVDWIEEGKVVVINY